MDRVEGVPIVYLLGHTVTGLVKIGRSKRMRQRLKTLQREEGADLVWLSYLAAFGRDLWRTEDESYWLERDLHKRFAAFRVRGEWFLPADPILDHFGVVL